MPLDCGGSCTACRSATEAATSTTTPACVTVDKRKTRYAEIARAEADRAARLLTAGVRGHPVPVAPVLSIVGASAVGGTRQPHQVSVVPAKRLVGWLRQQPALYSRKASIPCTPSHERARSRSAIAAIARSTAWG